MSNGKGNNMQEWQEEWVDAGFIRLDDKYISPRAPKIQWGELYQQKTDAQKIEYLEKLASSQNEAAAKIMAERDELNRLCMLKEAQLTTMTAQVRANNEMLQQQVTAMNQERQDYNEQLMQLSSELKVAQREIRDNIH